MIINKGNDIKMVVSTLNTTLPLSTNLTFVRGFKISSLKIFHASKQKCTPSVF
jgi:hypothetical protein